MLKRGEEKNERKIRRDRSRSSNLLNQEGTPESAPLYTCEVIQGFEGQG